MQPSYYKWSYAAAGAVLGLGAPLGAMVLASFVHGLDSAQAWLGEYERFSFFYNYMLLSTVAVFTLFGYFLGRHADTIHAQETRFHELSIRDALTGIYNRRHLQERLEEEYNRALRYDEDLSLIFFDLDFFKKINDAYGHPAGDEMLKQLSDLIGRRIRDSDIFARYGGEEFAIILPQTAESNAYLFAESLREEVQNAFFRIREQAMQINISIGVCALKGNTIQNFYDMLTRADAAMYAAKDQGRNRTVVFHERQLHAE